MDKTTPLEYDREIVRKVADAIQFEIGGLNDDGALRMAAQAAIRIIVDANQSAPKALVEAAEKISVTVDYLLTQIARKGKVFDEDFGKAEFELMDLKKALALAQEPTTGLPIFKSHGEGK